jgi:WXG100 family type VII secretion target
VAGEVSKQDQALTRGAQMVSEARSELDSQLGVLRGKLAGIGSQWRGAGSTAFQGVMTRWDENTRRITVALNDFEANLRSSEQTYNASDEQQSSSFTNLQGRMG